jgi:hypothetical protein
VRRGAKELKERGRKKGNQGKKGKKMNENEKKNFLKFLFDLGGEERPCYRLPF